jgi:cytochrome c oxidase subunit 2
VETVPEVGGLLGSRTTAPAPAVRLIKVSAHRFEFLPNNLALKKGATVEIELDTQDVLMGFNAPDFAVRATIVPGQVTRVRFTPQKVGTFTFLCDVFCGSGHEDMSGTITVTE